MHGPTPFWRQAGQPPGWARDGWCSTEATYQVSPPYVAGNGETISSYQRDYAVFPCRITSPSAITGHPAEHPGARPDVRRPDA
jgi:hypothetical protein